MLHGVKMGQGENVGLGADLLSETKRPSMLADRWLDGDTGPSREGEGLFLVAHEIESKPISRLEMR